MTPGLRWYLTGTACFLVPGGIQMVLFPWPLTRSKLWNVRRLIAQQETAAAP